MFCLFGYVLAPFTLGDNRVLVPPGHDLDATQQTLLFAELTDKLLHNPRHYYDTDILYPDRTQMRGLEPCVGFVLLGLPFHALRFNDADVFELSRWAVFVLAMGYAFLLFRSLGVEAPVAAAGAFMCLAAPDLLQGFHRLQVLCIPLFLPILYHALMAWRSGSGRLGHAAGVFAWTALYPLCGMVNATVLAAASLFVAPLLVRTIAAQWRARRVAVVAVPILAAGAIDAAILAPWIRDRWDLRPYVDEAFLQVKHWNAMKVPLRLSDMPAFFVGRVGLALTLSAAALAFVSVRRHADKNVDDVPPRQSYLLLPALGWLAVAIAFPSSTLMAPARVLFQVLCYAALFLYWRHQVRFAIGTDQNAVVRYALLLTAGVGVFVGLMSFGPVYVSNANLFASHLLRMMFFVVPAVRSIREFDRVWIFALLFLSMYATVRLGVILAKQTATIRVTAAAVLIAAAMVAPYRRPVEASRDIVPPPAIMALAAHSSASGPIYVHPRMRWNSGLGVELVGVARKIHRPFVNGYLGIEPLWFQYAASVLARFPSAESIWLLRTWKVATVLSVTGDVAPNAPPSMTKVFDGSDGAVYEVEPLATYVPHPSARPCTAADAPARVPIAVPEVMTSDHPAITVVVPEGFAAARLEMAFHPSVVDRIPASMDIYDRAGAGRRRLNDKSSGEWIHSLAAEALVRRRVPVVTVVFNSAHTGNLEVEFEDTHRPPIGSIALCGTWTHDAARAIRSAPSMYGRSAAGTTTLPSFSW